MTGPLAGYRIIEIAGIGPGPFAAMLLADMGAEVIRVERAAAARGPAPDRPHVDVTLRGRRNLAIDLKHPDGVGVLLDLVERADALIEGFRPGAMERLGAGPEDCLARNPRLVYGRMTGWGQDGPWAHAAGHDINYISLAGALAHFRRAGQPPTPPLNMVGDYGGGAMFLAFGVVCALLEAQRSGRGQVVDAAMVDGAALLMTMFWTLREIGAFDENQAGTNLLDTGAHFYDVYECADGTFISSGRSNRSSTPSCCSGSASTVTSRSPGRWIERRWPQLKLRFAELFKTRTRDEWCAATRRHRRLLRPGADDVGSDRPPAQRGTQHVRRRQWESSAGAGASIQPHPCGDRHRTRPSRPALAGDPDRLGGVRRAHRGAGRVRGGRRHLTNLRRV